MMEFLSKVLLPLGLSSFAICLEIPTSLSIQTPLGFDFRVGSHNEELLNNIQLITPDLPSPPPSDQCFCFPNNSDSNLVTEKLESNQEIERLVVFLYKDSGSLKAFIPNPNKQMFIPDLSFDEANGDILQTIVLETVGDLFDNNPSITKQQAPQPSINVDESNTNDNEPNTPHTETPTDIHHEGIASDANVQTSEVNDVSTNQFDDNILLDEKETEENVIQYNPESPVQDNSINDSVASNNKISDDYEHLQEILLMLPADSRAYLESLLPQLQSIHPGNINFLTFDNWFNNQLSHLLLENFESYSQVIAFRHAVFEAFKSNRMYLANNGMFVDTNGKIVDLTNIKLRPILISDLTEYGNMLNRQTNQQNGMPITEIPYHQMVLITQVNPPKILGLVPIAKVYVPINIIKKQKPILGFDQVSNTGTTSPKIPCHGCTPIQRPKPTPVNNPSHLDISRNFKNGQGQIVMQHFPSPPMIVNEHPQRRFSSRDALNLNGVMERVLGMVNARNSPVIQSRRVLGGFVYPYATPGPTIYPNDILPGLRIVGGKDAVSSGTPLVTRGRSGRIYTH